MRYRIPVFAALATLFLLICAPAAFSAGTPLEYRHTPDTACDSVNGRYLVVYHYVQMGTNEVRARLLDAGGVPLGPEVTLSDGNALLAEPYHPAVAFSPASQVYMVVWIDYRNSGTPVPGGDEGIDIYGQLVDASGQPVTRGTPVQGLDNFPVSSAVWDQTYPDVAHDSVHDQFLAVWQDMRDGEILDIYGQLMNADGTPLYPASVSDNFPVSDATMSQYHPALAFDPASQRYFVVFGDERGGDSDIYGQFLDSAGTAVFTPTYANQPVSTAQWNQAWPATALDPNTGRFLTVWQDSRVDSETWDIYGQLVDASDGSNIGSNFVVSDAYLSQTDPAIAADPANNRFGVVFSDDREESLFDIYGQLVDNSGGLVETASGTNVWVAGPRNEFLPAIAHGASYLVPYQVENSFDSADPDVRWVHTGDDLVGPGPSAFLLGHYPFDTGAGTKAYDASPYANDGTIYGADWTGDIFGDPAQALYFDGTDYVEVNAAAVQNPGGPFSLTVWVKPSNTAMDVNRTIVAKGAPGALAFDLFQYGNEVHFRVSSDGTTTAGSFAEVSSPVLVMNQWTHVACVWDGDDLYLYADGLEVAGPVPFSDALFVSGDPLKFGFTEGYYAGAMDDVRLYGMPLSGDQPAVAGGLSGRITGTLTAGGYTPVSGGTVMAVLDGIDYPATARSDAVGNYTLYLFPDCAQVSAIPPAQMGYQYVPGVNLYVHDVDQGGSVVDFDFPITAYTISGRVGMGMTPIPGVQVHYFNEAGVDIWRQTDEIGGYDIEGVPPGPGRVTVMGYDMGLGPQSAAVDVQADIANLDFTMAFGGTIQGVVVDPQNNPVVGVEVHTYSPGMDTGSSTVTDALGIFNLTGLPAGIVFVQASPSPETYFCESSEVPVALGEAENKVMGAVTVVPGTLVSGQVLHVGDPQSGLRVESQGLTYSTDTGVCNGGWAMVLPLGFHRVFLDSGDGAACPVEVSVTAADVLYQNPVLAPDMEVYYQGEGGGADVTVNDPGGWVDPAEGRLVVAAITAGSLAAPVTPGALVRIGDFNATEIVQTGVAQNVGPLCPGTYDFYLVWQVPESQGPERMTVLDSSPGVYVPAGTPPQVTLDLPSDYSPLVTGQVLTDNGTPAAGAAVIITDASGAFLGYATADESGWYTFTNLPAPAGGAVYDAQAFCFGLTGNPTVQFNVQAGADAQIPDLVLTLLDYPGVSVVETFRAITQEDVFEGAQGQVTGHVRRNLWFYRPYGTEPQVILPVVSYLPGFLVENVFGEFQYVDGQGNPHDDSIFPGTEVNPNTVTAQYGWNPLPSWDSPNEELGIFSVESAQTSLSIPATVTRTFQGAASAAAYNRWVTIQVVVTNAGIERIDLDIYDEDLPIALAQFDAGQGGLIEGGLPVPADEESYNNTGFARRSILNPVPGQVYEYSRLLNITPISNQGVVDYVPRTGLRIHYPATGLAHNVNGNTLEVRDIPGMGSVDITPSNQVVWVSDLMIKQEVVEVVQARDVGETGAVRPAIADRYPTKGAANIPTASPWIGVQFTKSMNTGGLYFRLWDQWGNVLHDSRRGPITCSFQWSQTALPYDTVTITPAQDFEPGTAYSLAITGVDTAGYQSRFIWDENHWTFTTLPVAGDQTAPQVVSNFPWNGQTNVPVTTPRVRQSAYILAIFSEAVLEAGVPTGFNLTALDGQGGAPVGQPIPCTHLWRGKVVSLVPTAPLAQGTWHRVTVNTDITDTSGNPMAQDYSWEFQTGAAPGAGPVFTFSMDGLDDVETNWPALILYPDKEIDPATLNSNNIQVTDSLGGDWSDAFEFDYAKPSTGVILRKKAENTYRTLPSGETFTVTVGAGVTDLSGNPCAGQVFSFTTTAPFANNRPNVWSFLDGDIPVYPFFYLTPNLLYFDMEVQTSDADLSWPGERLAAQGDMSGYTFDFTNAASGYLFTYQTNPVPPGETVASGDYNLDFGLTDSAAHVATRDHPVTIFASVPQLVSPADGASSGWPPTVSWQPSANTQAYVVAVCDDGTCTNAIGSFLVPDDGRAGDYALTLPADLNYPGAQGWWQVLALRNVDDSLAPWGGAASAVRRFVQDSVGPVMSQTQPLDGAVDVGPGQQVAALLTDADSEIYTPSITLSIDGAPLAAGEFDINDTDPANVWVTWPHPDAPLTAGQTYAVSLDCQDTAGNPLSGTGDFSFTVRNNATLDVPGSYATIQDALNQATAGDTVNVAAGTYYEDVVLTGRHSGVLLQGAPGAVIQSVYGVNPSVTLSGDATNVVVTGFTITGGDHGVAILDTAMDNIIWGNIIQGNAAAGVYISAEGANEVVNNLIYSNANGVFVVIRAVGGVQYPLILNNTIVDNGGDGVYLDNVIGNVRYNIVAYNGGFGIQDTQGTSLADWNDVYGNTNGGILNAVDGGHNITAIPGFVNRPAFDYTLTENSPPVNAIPYAEGIANPAAPPDDLVGTPRPQPQPEGDFDMGCYEFVDTTPPFLAASVPANGAVDVGPYTEIVVTLADPGSGVYTPSIQIDLNGVLVPWGDLRIDDTDVYNVTATYTPDLPFSPGAAINADVVCQDRAGNAMAAGSGAFPFTVRNPETITVPTDFQTIQEALDNAAAGDTVQVLPGTYVEDLDVGPRQSGVTLLGGDPRTTVIQGTGAPFPALNVDGAQSFKIQGFAIEDGAGAGIIVLDTMGSGGNVRVAGNMIRNNNGPGIWIVAPGHTAVENNLIVQNQGDGIEVFFSEAGTPAPVILFNTIAANAGNGIDAGYDQSRVYYNILSGNDGFGISALSSAMTEGYNDLWDNTLGAYSGIGPGEGDMAQDPQLQVPAPLDSWPYLPAPGSPVIDALAVPGPPCAACPDYLLTDMRGEIRPMGSGDDMGCFELRDYPTPPTPVEDVGGEYVAMAGRLLSIGYTATDEAGGALAFGFQGNPPQGMAFVQPGAGANQAALQWNPLANQVNQQFVVVPTVTGGGVTADGQAITITVLAALTVTPDTANPLVFGEGPGAEKNLVQCNITGGTPPYTVTLTRGDGAIARLNGLVYGQTAGPFEFEPLSATPSADNPTSILIQDSTDIPVPVGDPPKSFSLVSGAFTVNQVVVTLAGEGPVDPETGGQVTVSDGSLGGMVLDIPAGATGQDITITVGLATEGGPFMGGNHPSLAHFSPEGQQFARTLTVQYPVPADFDFGPGRTIYDLVAFYFDADAGKWVNIPITSVDPVTRIVTFSTDHFSLYTLAVPEDVMKALSGGSAVTDYRLACFPANAAESYTMTELLGTAANLGPYNDTVWRLFAFDPEAFATGDPDQYYVEADDTEAGFDDRFGLAPSQVYWVISRYGAQVSVPGLVQDPTQDFYTTLVPGWNAVGNPYNGWGVDWTGVFTFDGETWYQQSSEDAGNPLLNELLYDYRGAAGYSQTAIMNPTTGYFVYCRSASPVTLKIPVEALSQAVVGKADSETETWLARAGHRLSALVGTANADSVTRQPPSPPGTAGTNAGTSADSIGVDSSTATGGGLCFVETARAGIRWDLLAALAGLLFCLGLAVRRFRAETVRKR